MNAALIQLVSLFAVTLTHSAELPVSIEELQSNPKHCAEYYYNLGTLYGQKKAWTQARPYLELAAYLNPIDRDIRNNRDAARAQTKNTPTLQGWDGVFLQLSQPLFLSLASLLFMIVFAFSIFKKRPVMKALGALGVILCLCVFWRAHAQPGAFLSAETIARSGPDDSFLDLGTLPPATRVRVLTFRKEAQTAWAQIRFRADETAWVPASKLLLFSEILITP